MGLAYSQALRIVRRAESTMHRKTIFLKSSNGDAFEVERSVAVQSQTIKETIESNCAASCIALPNVCSNILSKVLEYCNRHHTVDEVTDEDLEAFDSDFVNVDQKTLCDLSTAANELKIKNLVDLLTCQTEARVMIKKNYTYEEICKICKMKTDFISTILEKRKDNNFLTAVLGDLDGI